MEYSVEDVCKLAKISVRALHYYDEIGLLLPATRMKNGRRYYGEEQVIRLMDIIFFKKFGFNLKKIASILNLGNKDKRALMIAKREFLEKEIKRIKELIKSIDVTLEFYYKGENINYNQMIKQFESFQKTAKEDKQNFLNEFGSIEDEETEKFKNMNVEEQMKYFEKLYKKVDMKQYQEKLTSVMKKIVEAIDNNLEVRSNEVQALMKEYFEIINMIHPLSKKKWLRMGITIEENKENYIVYAKIHPKMPEFLAKAIKVYGKNIKE
jgi:MerR family transcriptional regulator, thiopeptide resistance regulator